MFQPLYRTRRGNTSTWFDLSTTSHALYFSDGTIALLQWMEWFHRCLKSTDRTLKSDSPARPRDDEDSFFLTRSFLQEPRRWIASIKAKSTWATLSFFLSFSLSLSALSAFSVYVSVSSWIRTLFYTFFVSLSKKQTTCISRTSGWTLFLKPHRITSFHFLSYPKSI